MIDIEGLDFRYAGSTFRLRIPRLRIAAGERVAVVGPSGCGKTTLLHLIAGILVPPAGRIGVDGVAVSALSDAQRRDLRSARIGLVFQEFELVEYLGVLDNVLLPYRVARPLRLDGSVRARARQLAQEMGVGGALSRPVRKLSHGERQRVAVCRALVTEPPLLLADEPTGNLDPANKERVLDLLDGQARKRGATLVTVTHDHGVLDRFERVLDAREWQA